MQAATQVARTSKSAMWAGRIITALMVLFLIADAVPKIMRVESIVKATAQTGYPESLVAPIGITLLVCTIVYVIPRSAVLGAILLTGYLGGATATMVRIQNHWFLFPVCFGILVWAGLFFRDQRVRALIPLRSKSD